MCPHQRLALPVIAVADDALDLAEVVDAPIGIFAPVARLLVAAEGREGVPVRDSSGSPCPRAAAAPPAAPPRPDPRYRRQGRRPCHWPCAPHHRRCHRAGSPAPGRRFLPARWSSRWSHRQRSSACTNQPRFSPAGPPDAAGDQRRAFVDARPESAAAPCRTAAFEISGPIVVASSRGSPVTIASAVALATASASSCWARGTNIRVGASQDWPVLPNDSLRRPPPPPPPDRRSAG